jgi:dipeptidyl aminopeptidase/acylaminoacyl peptidase
MSRSIRWAALFGAALAAPLHAQQPDGAAASPARARGPLTEADYGKIETLGASALSPDGKWVAYDFRRNSGGSELRYRALSAPGEQSVRSACAPTFSSNSRWLLYTMSSDTSCNAGGGGRGRGGGGGPPPATGRGASPPRYKVGIVDLRSGRTISLQDVQSYSLSKNGSYVALRRYPPAGRQSRGADLVVRDLEQGTDLSFGNVADFAWSDDGSLLAMTIDVEGKTGNAVQLLNVGTGAIRALDAGDVLYAGLAWRPKSDDLAAFRSRVDSGFVDTSYTVLSWRGLATPRPAKLTYEFSTDNAFPQGMRVAAYRAPQWSEDGKVLFFGIAPREPKAAPMPRGQQPARVEVWHWKDLRQYHQQDRQSQQDRQKTQLVAWSLGTNKLARLADDSLESVQLSEDERVAFASDERPYFTEAISGRQFRDVYRVDLVTGKREMVITKTAFPATVSAGGRYLLYTQGGHWWSYDLTNGTRANLTAKVNTSFVNMEDDHPVPERRPYGVAGWTTGDKTVILYDRFDLWQASPDGSGAHRLTRGREDTTVYRLESLDPDARTIDPSKPLILSAAGEWSKKSGYARLAIGQAPQRLLWVDKNVSRLEKAKNADVFAYVAQTYQESPNVFVSGPAMTDATQISHTNAFLSDFAWGKQVLMDYTNGHGDKLQMMLTYPADYRPGVKYPMVVYYYEKLSQGFHQFVVPSERATYNTTVFSQNGYFVLRPDIVFRAREPGYSGLDCVTSAVKTVLATGMIDPGRVGNMGHSWGGYQSAFYAVHGKGMFAATIAGAPLTNLISMYGYTSFNTGLPETAHFETGQERMQVPLWEDPQAYIRNSTVFAVDSLQTPLLLEEGDADGNVNYWQSMELYNFGRRLGKNVVFLIYNDENHGVARPESQMDYHRRQLEWFNHYLKGAPPATWITHGETYLARQKMLKEATAREGEVAGSPTVQAGRPTAGVRP